MANGISFLPNEFLDFQLPSLSLYRLSTDALSMVTVLPLTVASFSHNAQDTLPARNFFNGFAILSPRDPSSDVTGLFLKDWGEGRAVEGCGLPRG